jgi:predicted homoserine dehydrogenase-like protein
VWDYYGLSAEQAAAAGMNSKMFNSFLDGTKSAIEMAAIANASGLQPAATGLAFPPCGTDDLAGVLRPKSDGGQLAHKGQVEVVSSLERDGRPVYKDLRWGVYVVIEAPNDYAASCFSQYGLVTDESGRYAAMYKPFHLIGLELNVSIFSAALRREAVGQSEHFIADVVATAKRDLVRGERLDGEGGYTVWGRLMPSADSVALGAVPIGFAQGIELHRDVKNGEVVRWEDVANTATANDAAIHESHQVMRIRRQMETHLSPSSSVDPATVDDRSSRMV